MTKDKLLELYELSKKGGITKEKISELRTLSDEDIDIVLKSKRPYEVQKLLESKNFKSQPKEIQEKAIKIFENCHASSLKMIFALSVAINENAIVTGHVLELIGIILRSKNHNAASIASNFCEHKYANISGNVVELARLISKCEGEQAIIGLYASVDKGIARSGRVVEIVKSILAAKDKTEATKIYDKELAEAMKTNLLEALNKGYVSEISFWELFKEEPDKAIKFLTEPIATADENHIYENNTDGTNNIKEISAHGRIRRRKKSVITN